MKALYSPGQWEMLQAQLEARIAKARQREQRAAQGGAR
jgi:hypothetical protein